MEGKEEISVRLMNDYVFRAIAARHLMGAVYGRLKRGGEFDQ